jgi:hypothetical protein
MPRDGGSYLVADAATGSVAPYTRGMIHNNPGTPNDWQYGEAITHWMPLPSAPNASHERRPARDFRSMAGLGQTLTGARKLWSS